MSYQNYDLVFHPRARVLADGWESTLGTLHEYGWVFEYEHDHMMMAHRFVMRNPTKFMTGICYVTDESMQMQMMPSHLNTPVAFLDERILIKAELYQEMRIPQMALYQAQVAEPISPYVSEFNDTDWRIYDSNKSETEIIVTPDKIPHLLSEIRKAQEPRAKEILHSQRRREMPKIQQQAKILAFG